MSQLLVAVEPPNTILEIETSLQTFLGFVPHRLVGQSFQILQGPLTNKDAVGRAMMNAAMRNIFTECLDMLYDINGQSRECSLSFSPCLCKFGRPTCCLITIIEECERPHTCNTKNGIASFVLLTQNQDQIAASLHAGDSNPKDGEEGASRSEAADQDGQTAHDVHG